MYRDLESNKFENHEKSGKTDWKKEKSRYLNFTGIKIRNHWDWAESINKALSVVIAVKYACN